MLQTRSGKRTGYAAVVIATDFVAEKLMKPKEALLLVEPAALSQLLSPVFDPAEWKKLPVATKGLPASPGAASGQVVFTVRAGRGVDRAGQEGAARPEGDRAGRHPRHGSRAGHPDRDRRHDVARRRRRPPDGPAVGRRRAARCRSTRRPRRSRSAARRSRKATGVSFDGLTGEVKLGKVATKPSEILQVLAGKMKPERVGHLPALQHAAGLGRQGPHAGHPRQRRPAGSVRAGVRLRRARHRPVPHRAHVLRRGPHREGAAHDPRRQREGPPRGAGRAAAAAARGLLRRVQGDARRAGHDPHDRSAAARVPAEARGPDGRDREARGQRAATPPSWPRRRRCCTRVEQLHEFNPMLGHRGVPPRHHLSRDHRDAGAGHLRGGVPAGEGRPQGRARGHDSARRPRQGAARPEGDRRPRGRRGHEGAGASRSSTWSAR